jgi:hypothetical protein
MICVEKNATTLLQIFSKNIDFFCYYKLSQNARQWGMSLWMYSKTQFPTGAC